MHDLNNLEIKLNNVVMRIRIYLLLYANSLYILDCPVAFFWVVSSVMCVMLELGVWDVATACLNGILWIQEATLCK